MKIQPFALLLFFLCFSLVSNSQDSSIVVVSDYSLVAEQGKIFLKSNDISGLAKFEVNGDETDLLFQNGIAPLELNPTEKGELLLLKGNKADYKLFHVSKNTAGQTRIRKIPFWLSVVPPLVAIILALIFKEVIVSLFIGVWTGAFIAGGMRIDSLYYFFDSIFSVVERFVISALADSGHLSVLIFSLLIGGMVAVISRNGGMAGVVQSLSRYAKSARSSQFITWLLGVAIFFDDYANTLIVGNTMRSVTDKFKISREKLAYIVDSTAAPVSAVAFITTWIGAELGYIDAGMSMLDDFGKETTPYAIFLSSLKYSFYPILTLSFILMLVYTQKDFGPMLKAEKRARSTGKVSPSVTSDMEHDDEKLDPIPGAPLKWYNAAIPVLTVIFVTIYGLIDTGMTGLYATITDSGIEISSPTWGQTWAALNTYNSENASFFFNLGSLIGSSDSYVALLWASFAGVFVAIFMTMAGKIMRLEQAISTMTTGFKAMLPALMILTLAWSLASTTEQLNTATYLSSTLEGSINPFLMPVIVFILAAFISFATGSSWSTMAILYPIVIPTTWAICSSAGLEQAISTEILLNVISITLGASVLGDHCSPISDTTILSSLASDCNHIDHVRTQLPYALSVGVVSIILCFVSTLLGGGWFICFVMLVFGLLMLGSLVWFLGKKSTP